MYIDGDVGGSFLVGLALRETPVTFRIGLTNRAHQRIHLWFLQRWACRACLWLHRLLDWYHRPKLLPGGNGICVSFVFGNIRRAHAGNRRVPLAGGQYSMVSEYAPPGASRYLSYITGKCSQRSGITFCLADLSQAGLLA